MKTKLFLVICIVALTINSAEAFEWQKYIFMISTPKLVPLYKLLDQLIMTFFKPIMSTVFYEWSSPLICSQLMPIIFQKFGDSLVSSLTDADKLAICNQGIQVFVNNYLSQGLQVGPIDTTWAGSIS